MAQRLFHLLLFFTFYVASFSSNLEGQTYKNSYQVANTLIKNMDHSQELILLHQLKNVSLDGKVTTELGKITNGRILFSTTSQFINKSYPEPFNFASSSSQLSLIVVVLINNPSNIFSWLLQASQASGQKSQIPTIFFVFPIKNITDFRRKMFELIDEQQIETEKALKNIVHINSHVYIVPTLYNTTQLDINIWEMYFNIDGELILEMISVRNLGKTKKKPKYFILPVGSRRGNLRQASVRCTAQNDPNYNEESYLQEVDGKLTLQSGFSVKIFFNLQHAMNFSIIAVQGKGWPDKDSSGNWTGMGLQLINNEVDIAISHAIIISERVESFAFLHSTNYGNLVAFFRAPRANFLRDIYKYAFDLDLWIGLLSIWILLWISIVMIFEIQTYFNSWINDRFQPNVIPKRYHLKPSYKARRAKNMDQDDDYLLETIPIDSFLWAIGSFCQQGWYKTPKTSSIKIIFLTASILALVSYIAFSASLVSNLSTEPILIKSYEDLVNTKFKILIDKDVPFIKEFAGDLYIYQTENELDIETSIKVITNNNKTSNTAFITIPEGFVTAFRRLNYSDRQYCENICNTVVNRRRVQSGMFLIKGSPYREIFNCKILMLLERGLSFIHIKRYQIEVGVQCMEKNVQFQDHLELEDVMSGFYILIGGHILSIGILCIEILVKFLRRVEIHDAIS